MDRLLRDFGNATASLNGYQLAETLSPASDNPDRLRSIWTSIPAHSGKNQIARKLFDNLPLSVRLPNDEAGGWVEVYHAYWKATGEVLSIMGDDSARGKPPSWIRLFETWRELVVALHRGYTNYGFEAWTIPCLYVAGKYLRIFAMKSDEERNNSSTTVDSGATLQDDFDLEQEKHQNLEDCARQLNKLFMLCLTDRAPLDESRKWGIYCIVNLLFKTYFKLNSASLSRNILKSLSAAYKGDMPPLTAFPASQQVTFRYYEGVLSFLEENYVEAEKHLTEAWSLCHKDSKRNQELILTYLIPCHLLTTHTLPSRALLEPYPRLQTLFLPLSRCIKKGELHQFDLALQQGEEEFVKRRIYLTLERGRDVALRNLLRKVFIAGGFEEPKEPGAAPLRRTRIPVVEFAAAISLGSQETVDNDEVECLLANMIYKNLMKGYIARERGIVVLSKAGAFPGTGKEQLSSTLDLMVSDGQLATQPSVLVLKRASED